MSTGVTRAIRSYRRGQCQYTDAFVTVRYSREACEGTGRVHKKTTRLGFKPCPTCKGNAETPEQYISLEELEALL